jgi:UDPglucose 6-dehydrogenase
MKFVRDLLEHGAEVCVHDPVAINNARQELGATATYASSSYEACAGADVLAVMTEWREYRSPDFARIAAALTAPRLLDARNLYNPARLKGKGFVYASIGREAVGAPAGAIFSPN